MSKAEAATSKEACIAAPEVQDMQDAKEVRTLNMIELYIEFVESYSMSVCQYVL